MSPNGTWNIGNWQADFSAGWLRRRRRLPWVKQRPGHRLMAVLYVLAEAHGRTVSSERILSRAWPGRVVSPDSVSTAVYQLRQLLGDGADRASPIETVARRGYRLSVPVRPTNDHRAVRAFFAVLLVGLLAFSLHSNSRSRPALEVAVLLDRTGDRVHTPLVTAMDATLRSELVSRNPGRVFEAGSQGERSLARLEGEVVACDAGLALVLRLVAPAGDRYLWGETYALEAWQDAPGILVSEVARDVTRVLRRPPASNGVES